MKYFKTRGERIFLAIFIAWAFCWLFFIFGGGANSTSDFVVGLFYIFSPIVLYTMYKLIFQKEK
jgi:hypothetical protein